MVPLRPGARGAGLPRWAASQPRRSPPSSGPVCQAHSESPCLARRAKSPWDTGVEVWGDRSGGCHSDSKGNVISHRPFQRASGAGVGGGSGGEGFGSGVRRDGALGSVQQRCGCGRGLRNGEYRPSSPTADPAGEGLWGGTLRLPRRGRPHIFMGGFWCWHPWKKLRGNPRRTDPGLSRLSRSLWAGGRAGQVETGLCPRAARTQRHWLGGLSSRHLLFQVLEVEIRDPGVSKADFS